MDTSLLRSDQTVVYEPHLFTQGELPFIFHQDVMERMEAICNMHENVEFLSFSKGSARVRVGDAIHSPRAGEIICVDSMAVHQVVCEEKGVYHCLIVDSSFLTENGIDPHALRFEPILRDPEANAAFARIVQAYRSTDAFRSAAIKGAVLSFLLYICRHHARLVDDEERVSSQSPTVRAAVEYIKSHLSEPIRLDELAEHVHLSKYHLLRQFKRITGDTVVTYVNRLRCEHAKRLLREGGRTVHQISEACGFESDSYFITVFKKFTAMTPTEYAAVYRGETI